MKTIGLIYFCFAMLNGSLFIHNMDSQALEAYNVTDITLNYNTKITITHFTQYCGGPQPSAEIVKNQTQLYINTNFILIHLNTGKKTTVQTNSEGQLLLSLSNGKYAIRET